MNDERGPWYLLTGIILGIGLGLLYSWVISPAEFVDTPPASLRNDYKDQYRAAIAGAYAATGDFQRAQSRLELLNDNDPSLELVVQAQRYLAEGDDFSDAQSLAFLASAYGQAPTPIPTQPDDTPTMVVSWTSVVSDAITSSPTSSFTPTPTEIIIRTPTPTLQGNPSLTPLITPTLVITGAVSPSLTPTITLTPFPSRTPTATLAPPFVLDKQINVCDPFLGESQMQVLVTNSAGVGVPGVEIIVLWGDTEDHFFSGMKPDINIGYADFVMTPEINYSIQVGTGGQLISNLVTPPCTDVNGYPYSGSIRLVFTYR